MNSRFHQRGAVALVVALVLLFGMTLIAFFANRTMIFEQRTSANQYRYTKAFEVADAGIEWAIARLNDGLTLTANSCTPASGAGLVSFRDRYVRPTAADATHANGWLNPLSNVYPGCQIDPAAGTFSCGCPAAGAATLAATAQPRFRVQFNPVTSPTADALAVEIVSRGCTSGDPCDPASAATASDSSVVARVLVKIVPTFPTVPGAGLISGSATVISGSLNVVNTDTAGNGITINTGSTVNLSGSGTTVQTLPGTPPSASILDNDPSLLKLTNADSTGERFFSSFFGGDFDDFKTSLGTKVITAGASNNAANLTCGNPGDCGAAVSYWVNRGIQQFWVVPDVTFNNSNMPSVSITGGTLGTLNKPLALATPGQITFTGGITAYGVYYAATASAVDDLVLTGGGSSTIVGSLISRGDFARTGNGNISIIYNSNLFGGKGPPTGILAPVPGSWRDKATAF